MEKEQNTDKPLPDAEFGDQIDWIQKEEKAKQSETGPEVLEKNEESEMSKEEQDRIEKKMQAEVKDWKKRREGDSSKTESDTSDKEGWNVLTEKGPEEGKYDKIAKGSEKGKVKIGESYLENLDKTRETIDKKATEVINNPDAQPEDIKGTKQATEDAKKQVDVAAQKMETSLRTEGESSALLEEKRNAYMEAYQKSIQEKSGFGSAIRRVFSKGDGSAEELEGLKSEYDKAKYEYCKDLVANKKAELEKRKISGEALDKRLAKYKFNDLYLKMFVEERKLLQDAKVESWPSKEKGIFRKGFDWWMRQGRVKRIVISTLLITGLSFVTGGVAAGGFGATGLFFGSRIVKAFTSGLIAQGAGGVVNKIFSWSENKAKKKSDEEESKSKDKFSKEGLTLDSIKAVEEQMQQATEKLEKSKRNKALVKGLTMIAVGAGSSIGLGLLGGAIMEIDSQQMETPPSGIAPEAGHIVEKISTVETASAKLDSVWKMAEHQLDRRGFFQGLSGSADEIAAKKTFIIDAIKDKIAENPSEFGLKDIHTVALGQEVDFSDIFKDENLLKEALLTKADKLSDQDIDHILEYNKLANLKGVVSETVNLQDKVVSSPTFGVSHEEYLGSLKEDFGLKLDEYDAVKDVKVEKFLDEISKYMKGEVLDEDGMRMYPNLPHDGIYGGFELRHQIKLADRLKEIIGTMPEKSSDMTVGELVKKYTDSFSK